MVPATNQWILILPRVAQIHLAGRVFETCALNPTSFYVFKITGNLSDEKNTWRMIGKLYHDRLFNRDDTMETDSVNYSAIVIQVM